MKNSLYIALLVALLAGSASGQVFTQTCPDPQFPSATAVGIDAECGAPGNGKKADAVQDQAKNNFCASGPALPISFDDLRGLQASVEANKKINFGNPRGEHPLSSKAGATTKRKPLQDLGEGQLRSLEAFISIARQEGPESVNCGSQFPKGKQFDTFHDIHISLVPDEISTHSDECNSVVAEMVPHHRPESWTLENVLKVATAHARVRATGQLFFDSSHTECVDGVRVGSDPSRFSVWEIHPIYKFEVCDADDCSVAENWQTLEHWVTKD